jgi:CDP-glucose 4,6-dehydratase
MRIFTQLPQGRGFEFIVDHGENPSGALANQRLPKRGSIQAVDDFWAERRVFLTGHTGFKGTWLSLWLREMGASVTGFALAPDTSPNIFTLMGHEGGSVIGDIRDAAALDAAMRAADPQVVIHMAAQALVRESYRHPVETFATNVMGTAHLLQSCRGLRSLQSILVVTSDKVYENAGEGAAFDEHDRLGGHDPYSNSKACCELLTMSFRDSFFAQGPPLATARAGNVIGGGDWSADRLIPDCVRALESEMPVNLRYPDAVRPWQHVLEPLSGYLALAQALAEKPAAIPRAVNFGPDPSAFCTVREVVDAFSARFAGKPGWRRDPGVHPQEAQALTLSSSLAQRTLGWRPTLDVTASLAWTADWYRAHAAGDDMLAFSRAQIAKYRSLSSPQR